MLLTYSQLSTMILIDFSFCEYMRCSDFIDITRCHVGGTFSMNKDTVICRNLTILLPGYSHTVHFDWLVIPPTSQLEYDVTLLPQECLQHGVYYCRQNDATMTPCILGYGTFFSSHVRALVSGKFLCLDGCLRCY